jgi:hypothetical protein
MLLTRHCERSEAIQGVARLALDCFVTLAMMDYAATSPCISFGKKPSCAVRSASSVTA